ncbi:MAG: hypothetical protein Q7J25_00205 [Vicinamibacterales bacterium]|nr:hypothetical protein [Vicinamibacterales bacterium]
MIPRLRSLLAVLPLLLVCSTLPRAEAASYDAVTFNELVARADVIFVGDVMDVRPFTVSTPEGTLIKTRVTFVVRDPLWGAGSTLEIFEFLGGEVGNAGMKVPDMPTFLPGDRRVVFARRERSINPIVGFTQGLLRVSRDSGVDAVQTSDGQPLARTEDIGRPRGTRVRDMRPMALSTLRAQIVDRLRERRR